MKAQCERCKEIVALHFRVDAGGIRVRCPECRADYFVLAEDARRPQLPDGDMVCPKCETAQPPAPACRYCGLVPENWRGAEPDDADHEAHRDGDEPDGEDDAADADGADADAAADASDTDASRARAAAATLARLWAACEQDWDASAPHKALLAYCEKQGNYALAAARYRRAAAQRGGSDAVAEAQLKRIRSLAELALAKTATRLPEKESLPYKGPLLILGIVVVLVLGGVFYGLLRGDNGTTPTRKGTTPSRPPPSLHGPR